MAHIKQIIGLDLGSHSVKAVWMQRGRGGLTVQRKEQLTLPPDAVDTHRLIQPWIDRMGLAREHCAIALPGTQTVFQPGRLPTDDPRNAQQAALMEVATFNDLAGDVMTHDVAPFRGAADERLYLITMARPGVIARALDHAEAMGVRPAELTPAPVALFNWYFRNAPDNEPPCLVVNLGHTQTELAIGQRGGLLFARAIAMGAKAFSDAIAQARQVPSPQAETLKVNKVDLNEADELTDLLRPLAERWCAQVASSIAVYTSQYPGAAYSIGKVLLCGGGARLKGLAPILRERLHVDVIEAESQRPDAGGVFDLACGLAATALGEGPTALSLLPQRQRDEVRFRAKKPYWIAAGIFGALALSVFTVSGLRELDRVQSQLRAEGAELQRAESATRAVNRARARSEQLRETAVPLRNLLLSGPVTRDLITLLANSIDPDDWISMVCDEASYTLPSEARGAPAARARRPLPGMRSLAPPPRAAPAAVETTPKALAVFIVEGFTPDPSLVTVQQLIERISANPLVAGADLQSDDRVLPAMLHADRLPPHFSRLHRFVLRVEVTPP